MHCAAFHFIKALGIPSQVTGKHKCSQKDVEGADGDDNKEEEDEDEDTDIDTSMDADASADNVEAMAEILVVDFKPGDTLGKLLAFINQLRMSSEDARKYLAHSCRMHNIKEIELRLWVCLRWGSLTHCLTATLKVQKVRYL